MKKTPLNIAILTAVAVISGVLGYKFLTISLGGTSPQLAPQPIVTTQQLAPVPSFEEGTPPPNGQTLQLEGLSVEERRAQGLELIKKTIEKDGSDVIDSRIFDTKAACDAAVKKVTAEYARRGIPATDMAETWPFPGSTGKVMMLRNGDSLFYIGCITDDNTLWAAYVQFRPHAAAQ